MVNYYEALKISPKATGSEIKSAYRRLARKLHPDRNQGARDTALKFAAIAEAYEVLGNPEERVKYDRRLLDAQYAGNGNGSSVFASTNPHAQRWRRMVYEKRYNDIIDRMIAEERNEAMAFQKAVYPAVALFVSGIMSTTLHPAFLDSESGVFSWIVILALFTVGVIHLIRRIREGLERYTESDGEIHDSILDGGSRTVKPYSRVTASLALGAGFVGCLAIGYLIGSHLDFAALTLPSMFSKELEPQFILYPPIVTLFVDMMHSFASKLDKPV